MNSFFRSLDGICAKNGAFPMDVIGLITVSVLKGLNYLYTNHKIVHRGMSRLAFCVSQRIRSFLLKPVAG